jgi:ribosomal protein S18 acetylase RimI-like enzyme
VRVPVELNALESARFGVVAAHVRDAAAAPAAVNRAAASLGVEMLTVRIDCGDHARIHAAEADGFRLMDSLVYYERMLAEPPPRPAPSAAIVVRNARPDDAAAVADVARAAFANYIGRFHADPRLDRAAADAAYVEWAQSSAMRQSDRDQAKVLLSDGRVAGFLTMHRNHPAEFEIVLNAVHPDFQRRGLYERLLAEALVTAHDAGAGRIIVSTQIDNFPVQRAWTKSGFRIASALHTFHKWYA